MYALTVKLYQLRRSLAKLLHPTVFTSADIWRTSYYKEHDRHNAEYKRANDLQAKLADHTEDVLALTHELDSLTDENIRLAREADDYLGRYYVTASELNRTRHEVVMLEAVLEGASRLIQKQV